MRELHEAAMAKAEAQRIVDAQIRKEEREEAERVRAHEWAMCEARENARENARALLRQETEAAQRERDDARENRFILALQMVAAGVKGNATAP